MTVLKQSIIPWGAKRLPLDGPDHTPAPSGLELAPESLCASLRCPGGLSWCWKKTVALGCAAVFYRYPLVKYSYGKSPF